MKRYFFQNSEIGFTKWCRAIPFVRHYVTSFYTTTSRQYREDNMDTFKECRFVYRQYKQVMKTLTEAEKDYFLKYLITHKVPPSGKVYNEYKDKIMSIWRNVLFMQYTREIKKLDKAKLGAYLKEKRKEAGYSLEDIQSIVGINIVSLRAVEEGRMDVKATHLYSMLWLYGVSGEKDITSWINNKGSDLIIR
jgi:hypothetical protein